MQQKKPYRDTTVSWERTQGDITGLLMSHGARGIQWTNVFERNEINFRFAHRVVIDGVEKDIGVEIRVPIRVPTKTPSGRDRRITAKEVRRATNQAYRAVYWWLKAQLEAVDFGIQSIEQVFFANIICRLPDGRQSTVGEALKKGILSQTDFRLEAPDVEVLPSGGD